MKHNYYAVFYEIASIRAITLFLFFLTCKK